MKRAHIVMLLLVAACSSGSSAAPASTTTTSAPKPAYTPVYARGTCNDEVPQDPRVECGTLTVPEDRTKPDGKKVVLPVAVVHTADPHPAPDPIVYFSGGPGFAGLPTAARFLHDDLTGNHDVIVFDQRGTGESQPSLACPEVYDANATINGNTQPFAEAQQVFRDAVVACANRLRENGVDLNQYNTPVVADDVADLRTAMGIEEWNLFGASYGTTVALQTMRAHPDGIRSVVIDSVFPTDVAWNATKTVTDFNRVQRVFFDGCAKDAACHARFPNLETDFRDAVAALDANPYRTTYTDTFSKKSSAFVIDGPTAAAGFYNALYNSDLIPQLPGVIEQIKAGTAGPLLDALVQQLGPTINGAAEAQHQSVNCSDRASSVDQQDAGALVAKDPSSSRLLVGYGVCPSLAVTPAPTGFNDQVHSDIPTLVYGNEYDPVTPPDDSH
ncbi:MAG TPA: alpha/beta fold hydrolase, partial [Acidimicrobiales bacterium]|nr:alpha/beta fold hydrolase [Acidimicrobiales bacterium]